MLLKEVNSEKNPSLLSTHNYSNSTIKKRKKESNFGAKILSFDNSRSSNDSVKWIGNSENK